MVLLSSRHIVVSFFWVFLFMFSFQGFADQTFRGTCEQFNKYAIERGVNVKSHLMSGNESSKGLSGVTFCEYESKWQVQVLKKDESYCASYKNEDLYLLNPKVQVVVLRWNPSFKVSASCQKEIQRYYAHVERHEQRHVKDCLEILEKYKPVHPKEQLVCEKTSKKAISKINEVILEDLTNGNHKSIQREIDERAQSFHQSNEGGKVPLIDCEVCR